MVLAKDIMTKNVKTCTPENTVADAAQIMQRYNVGVVPIVNEQGHCEGVVTDRDICIRVVAENKSSTNTPLSQIMSQNLVSCRPDDDVLQVIEKLEENQVKRIIVVDQQERCLGVISEVDLIRSLQNRQKIGEMAQHIYQ